MAKAWSPVLTETIPVAVLTYSRTWMALRRFPDSNLEWNLKQSETRPCEGLQEKRECVNMPYFYA